MNYSPRASSSSDRLTVGLAQLSPKLGDLDTNLAMHLEAIHQAHEQNVDLLIFPELSLTGYKLMDLVQSVALPAHLDHPILAALAEAAGEMAVVPGFVEEDARHRFYTAAAFIQGGQIHHVHRKIFLPTYGLFDEGRYLGKGEEIRAFDTPWGRAAILICEDFWHMSAVYLAWVDGADLMIFPTASPGRVAAADADTFTVTTAVEQAMITYAGLLNVHVLLCNRTGVEDGIGFAGASAIFSPSGEILARAPDLAQCLLVTELDLDRVRRTRMQSQVLRDERPHWVMRQLQAILDR